MFVYTLSFSKKLKLINDLEKYYYKKQDNN